MVQEFKAFVTNGDGRGEVVTRTLEDLPAGDVTIKVHYSSVNYKDGMALNSDAKIVKEYPIVPGIDLAGEVVESTTAKFKAGDKVIVTSYDLGTGQDGGYSQYARVPSDWVVPLPEGLTTREAMIIGTAGFTAALSIHKLEDHGLQRSDEPILVTGASGGVGSMAVDMLSKNGYSVTASTGKSDEYDFLRKLGADDIVTREEVTPEELPLIQSERWAAAVDPTGGKPLASILSATKRGGGVAVSGLTAGVEVPTSVIPFILRGVELMGIDSVQCPMDLREAIWTRAASDLKPEHLDDIAQEVSLDGLQGALNDILNSKVKGRVILRLH
ncbi:acryloyl-CoA reductase [Alkalicoccus daliensis]|uniref:Putative quinone oxidoreductase, YhdH/YhfP family n=1 Tax=Alkalicoccus daliensis TaxID=745820 RepID=A0A1H0DRB1_9BACI|nr:acryloyl-CoA reductase [Alkalicoccus daliensis]SDN72704.1 putative quinone oxidoreductase, YhdH/YhfP family [Alkalicoccus daliensis]